MKATIIERPDMRLIVAKSEVFPGGNRAAMQRIESELESLRGRKFYGLAFAGGGEMEWYAGLVPAGEAEEEAFVGRGFELLEVAGGSWARARLTGWQSKLDQLSAMFRELVAEFGEDPPRPQLEFYRSLHELHLLAPVRAD